MYALRMLATFVLVSFSGASAPDLPYVEKGVCPGEGCQYAVWTAINPTVAYDRWQEGRHVIGKVATKEKVTGLTGVAVTFRPGVIRVDRDLSGRGLKRGDTILTYTYRGEGFSAAWVNGRFEREYDISFTKWPDGSGCSGEYCAATYLDLGKKEWWAKVKLKSGQTGWVNMDKSNFRGTSALAELHSSTLFR